MINEILLQQARQELRKLEDNSNIRYELIGDFLMAMSNTEKQAAYVQRMKKSGFKRAAVWLSPESQEKIKATQEKKGLGRDDALNYLILRGSK